ncbi:MAG: hypothetical protein ACRDD1_02050, partial [Planctomycetia bacterium]
LVFAAGGFVLMVGALGSKGPGRAAPAEVVGATGSVVYLWNGSDKAKTWLYADDKAFSEMAAFARHDNEEGIRQLLRSGRIMVCDRGAKASVVARGFMSSRVRLADGREGTIPSEYLKAAPPPE